MAGKRWNWDNMPNPFLIAGGVGAAVQGISNIFSAGRKQKALNSYRDSLQPFMNPRQLANNLFGQQIGGQNQYNMENLSRLAAQTGGSQGAAFGQANAAGARTLDSFLTNAAPSLANLSFQATQAHGQAGLQGAGMIWDQIGHIGKQAGQFGFGMYGQQQGFQQQTSLMDQLRQSIAGPQFTPQGSYAAATSSRRQAPAAPLHQFQMPTPQLRSY